MSSQRSDLGAIQNRLEHTINNLDNVVENTQSAESQIRDTDMATEMVKYSNNNILAQAGQAMLAQSNQANQGVLPYCSNRKYITMSYYRRSWCEASSFYIETIKCLKYGAMIKRS